MLHSNIPLNDRHAPHNYEYADATAREAAVGFVNGDIGKLALQLDDYSYWVLSDTTPAWVNVQTSLTSGTTIKTLNSASLLGAGDLTVQETLVSGTNIKTVNSASLLGTGDVEVQETLVSGTNIKTVNSTSLLGSGDVAVQESLVSGTNIKTVNSTSLLGTGDVAVQESLVSGTNIKTVNSASLLGTGDVAVQETLVSGTNIKTVNSASLLGTGDVAVQATLVSGTNIKTVNSTSLLGTGDIAVQVELVSGTTIKTVNGSSVLGSGDLTVSGGISNIVTATASTTLTSTPTILQLTPAQYGITAKLPDATTCTEGGPSYRIENKGNYPVRLINYDSGVLGFIPPKSAADVMLVDNAAAAGVWSVNGLEFVAISAMINTDKFNAFCFDGTYGQVGRTASVDLGNGKEVLVGTALSGNTVYAAVYDSTTGSFGSPTLVRNASCASCVNAIAISSSEVLVVSCPQSSTGLEAVVLSISGTTITVNTAATATLSAAMSVSPFFAEGCGITAVNGSYVISYFVSGPVAQIRALTVSGTTVTIGDATNLVGTAGGGIEATASGVIAVSTASTSVYFDYYGVSGTTLTIGTGASYSGSTATLRAFGTLGSRWAALWTNGSSVRGAVISLSSTTVTISTVNVHDSSTFSDAIRIGTNKVFLASNASSNETSIMTDTSGTASVGSQVTGAGTSNAKTVFNFGGTDVLVIGGSTSFASAVTSCSGTSPSRIRRGETLAQAGVSSISASAPSNMKFQRSPRYIYGASAAFFIGQPNVTSDNFYAFRVDGTELRLLPVLGYAPYRAMSATRGKADNERWFTDTSFGTCVLKLECANV